MDYGDHLIHELAQEAGARYGSRVTSAKTEYVESAIDGFWTMEVWSRFEVEVDGGGFNVHYLPRGLEENLMRLVRDTTTINVEE